MFDFEGYLGVAYVDASMMMIQMRGIAEKIQEKDTMRG
jgi:hypothetical protein